MLGQSRYINPRRVRKIPERMLKYEYAEKLAMDIKPKAGMRVYCLLDGKFIFGDFFEAWAVCHNIHIKKMTIATLSLSEANVDSLANLLNGGFVDALTLHVSDYFFSHERSNLVKYIYQQLDKDDKFQLVVSGTHCKICLIHTNAGRKVVIHGSANLRSSGNLEQIVLEENPPLYDFNVDVLEKIEARYKTIRKPERHNNLWKTVNS